MIERPESVSVDLARERLRGGQVVVWCTPSVADRLRRLVPWPVSTEPPVLSDSASWLLAAGGGTLIDRAKLLRAHHPQVKLAALPTIWGSGAEASLIAVASENGNKVIRMGPELLPDLIVSHSEFARSASAELMLHACGDAWSHALEGFLSPLGNAESRADLAAVIRTMLTLPLNYTPEWFEVSALAAAGQTRTSVGAVHGIAHVLEGVLLWPHAKLCSVFLLPVLAFDRANSPKWPALAEHGLPIDGIFAVLRQLFDREAYRLALPALRSNWSRILRDPCSRTNPALVRPGDITFFESFLDE